MMLKFTSHLARAILLIGLFVLQPLAQAATDCTLTEVTQIPQIECEALIDIYNSTEGLNWIDNLGWNVTNTPCEWGGVFYQIKEKMYEKGVVCKNGHVRVVDLSDNNLNGPILSLHHNRLSGSIPDSLGHLSNLKILFLENNQFTG